MYIGVSGICSDAKSRWVVLLRMRESRQTHCIKNLRTYYLRFPTGRGGRKDPMGRFRMPGPTRRTVDRKADAWSQFEPVRAGGQRKRGDSGN